MNNAIVYQVKSTVIAEAKSIGLNAVPGLFVPDPPPKITPKPPLPMFVVPGILNKGAAVLAASVSKRGSNNMGDSKSSGSSGNDSGNKSGNSGNDNGGSGKIGGGNDKAEPDATKGGTNTPEGEGGGQPQSTSEKPLEEDLKKEFEEAEKLKKPLDGDIQKEFGEVNDGKKPLDNELKQIFTDPDIERAKQGLPPEGVPSAADVDNASEGWESGNEISASIGKGDKDAIKFGGKGQATLSKTLSEGNSEIGPFTASHKEEVVVKGGVSSSKDGTASSQIVLTQSVSNPLGDEFYTKQIIEGGFTGVKPGAKAEAVAGFKTAMPEVDLLGVPAGKYGGYTGVTASTETKVLEYKTTLPKQDGSCESKVQFRFPGTSRIIGITADIKDCR